MWFVGMILGAILGAMTGEGMGAVLGAVAGVWLGGQYGSHLARQRPAPLPDSLLLERLQRMERRWLELDERLQRLEQRGVALGPLTEAEPIPPAATEVPSPPVPETISTSPELTNATPATDALWVTLPARATVAPGQADLADSPAPSGNEWWQKWLGGNLLAKVGVVLLFFGVASALKLAVQHGMFPVPVRLSLAAAFAGGMIWLGWNRAQTVAHRAFGLALQGGGSAILYLLVYFMLARYTLIDTTAAFVLFTALGVSTASLAMRQDNMALAVLGIAGAFLSPVLAANPHGNHVLLFSYLALLNGLVFFLNWRKNWRQLNLLGLFFTLSIGVSWGLRFYQPQHFASTEPFLLLFFALYSLEPVLHTLWRARQPLPWGDGALLFGTPLITLALQQQLLWPYPYGLAWAAFLGGLYYLGLWYALLRRAAVRVPSYELAHLGIALALLTYSIPLAFGAQVTSALWTLEGGAALWLGLRQNRRWAVWSGLGMQFLAGSYFLLHAGQLLHERAVFNDVFIGACLIAVAGLTSGACLQRHANRPDPYSADLAWGWGLLWWLGSASQEISRFVAADWQDALWLLLAAVTAGAGEWLGQRWRWATPRRQLWLLWLALALVAADSWSRTPYLLAGPLLLFYPLAVWLHYLLMAEQEADGLHDGLREMHLGLFWQLTLIVLHDLHTRLALQWLPAWPLWHWLAWGLPLAGLIQLVLRGKTLYPFRSALADYRQQALLPLLLGAGGWLVLSCFSQPGDDGGLPYLPLLNPLDAGLMLVLYSLWYWQQQVKPAHDVLFQLLPWGGFLWLTSLAGRLAHAWGGIPFDLDTLWHAPLAQALLSGIWTLCALGLMIYATRQQQRARWLRGFALLALVGVKLMLVDLRHTNSLIWTISLLGIALLVIAASYVSPAPPKPEDRQ